MQVIDLEKEIISEFEMFDNWMEKYEYLIELGKDLPIISSVNKSDENIIKESSIAINAIRVTYFGFKLCKFSNWW